MRVFLTVLLTLSVACAHGVQAQQKPPENAQPDSVEAFLKRQMQKRQIPGLQVAVIKQGIIVLLGAYGLASIQDSIPVTNHTVFTINSMTKAFSGVAMMQLVEAGKLDLDAPVSRYLDDLPAAWRAVSIRRLLNNTSGLPSILDDSEQPITNGGEDALWAKVITLPIEAAPGERFKYNATNYMLIRRIIDKLSERPLARVITDQQMHVADMRLTRFCDSHDVIPNSARGYYARPGVDEAGHRTTALGNVFEEFPPYMRAAAGICSTAEDVARWVIALQSGQLLKAKSSVATMWTAGKLNDGSSVGFSPLLNGYAIGWLTVTRPDHPAVAAVGGARNALFVYPDDDLAIVILTNRRAAFPESLVDEVAGYYIPDMRAATGFGLPPAIKALQAELTKRGFDHALEVVNAARDKDPTFRLPEQDVNAWGYRLLERDRTREAIEVFKLNTRLFPESANTYDSLAEGYEAVGEKALAVRYYKQSLELNPKNTHAVERLEELQPH